MSVPEEEEILGSEDVHDGTDGQGVPDRGALWWGLILGMLMVLL